MSREVYYFNLITDYYNMFTEWAVKLTFAPFSANIILLNCVFVS